MILVTTDNIAGKEIEMLGMVKGTTVQSKHLGKDLLSGLKTLVGGELTAYTEMINEAKTIAEQRMIEQANGLRADAIVGVRFVSASVGEGAAEMSVYGTAVKFK